MRVNRSWAAGSSRYLRATSRHAGAIGGSPSARRAGGRIVWHSMQPLEVASLTIASSYSAGFACAMPATARTAATRPH